MASTCNTSLVFYAGATNLSSAIEPLFLATIIIAFSVLIICTAVFVYDRPYYDRLKVRHTFLVLLTGLGVSCQVLAGPIASLSETIFSNFPCWLRLLAMVTVPTLIGSSLAIRLMIFHFMSNLSRMAVRKHEEIITSESSASSWIANMFTAVKTGFKSFFYPIEDSRETLLALKFLVTFKGQLSIAILVWLPYLLIVIIVALVIPEYRNGCGGCKVFPTVFTIFTISALGFLSLGLFLYLLVRHESDYWGLGREIGYTFICLLIGAMGFLLAFFSSNYFQVLQTAGFTMCIIPQTIYPVMSARRFEGKRKVRPRRAPNGVKGPNGELVPATSLLSSEHDNVSTLASQLNLATIFSNDELYASFEKHLTAELAVESLLFLKDVRQWKATYGSNPNQNQTAKNIYKTYIKSGALFEINISHSMRSEIEASVDNDEVSLKCFDQAVKDITFLVQKGPLLRFSHTNECLALLSRLGGNISKENDDA